MQVGGPNDLIEDTEFVSGIQYLINEGIMTIPEPLNPRLLLLKIFLVGLKIMLVGGQMV